MFSKILLKLIDESIVPPIFLLATRLISVVLVARYNSVPFDIGANGFVFRSAQDYVLVNSYSTFFMISVLTIGLLYFLTKSLFFHDTHIKPHLTARLFSLRMHGLIQSTYNLYTQGSIWLSYCYLVMIVAGFMALFGLVFPWVFYVALVLCIVSTIFFVIDVEEELHLTKKDAATHKDEQTYFDDDEEEE